MSNLCVDVSEYQQTELPWQSWYAFGVHDAIVRAGIAHRVDAALTPHAVGARSAGLDVGYYWALLDGYDGKGSAKLFAETLPQDDSLMSGDRPRYWVDIEAIGVDAAQLTEFLKSWKESRPNARMGIYTSKYFWDSLIGPGHSEFGQYPLWVAWYNPAPPALPEIWDSYAMWQFRYKKGYLPDYDKDLDISEITMTTPSVAFGSKIGTHAINPGQTVPLALKARANGYRYPVMKMVNDASPLIQLKAIDPRIITICRYINPNPEWETLQNVGSWSADRMHQFAVDSIQLILGRTSPEQIAATDYFGVINETNPRDEAFGFTNLGLALIQLVLEANKHNLKLALPAFPQGCPEWNKGDNALGGGMMEMAQTGLFGLMKRTGHILDEHEGVMGDQPITYGYGDIIPRAPYVFGAGSTCFRHRYLYQILANRDEVIPLVISEFYAGGGYPQDQSIQSILDRFIWYDKIARSEPYLLGFLGFTIGPDATWTNEDYTKLYVSDELDRYMRAEANIPNPEVPMDVAKIIADATEIKNRAQAILDNANGAPMQPLYNAHVLQNVKIRDGNGVDTGRALTVGTQVAVYAEHITAGTYTDRARINVNGDNVAMTNDGKPTLQKV